MNKLATLLIIMILILAGCSNEPEQIVVNNKEVMESEYIDEKLEFTSTYTIFEENTEEGYIIYDMNVHIYNAKLSDVEIHLNSIEVTDFDGNTYTPMENSKNTTAQTVESTSSVDLDFYIKMPIGQKPRDVYFYDDKGNFLDEITYDYDDQE